MKDTAFNWESFSRSKLGMLGQRWGTIRNSSRGIPAWPTVVCCTGRLSQLDLANRVSVCTGALSQLDSANRVSVLECCAGRLGHVIQYVPDIQCCMLCDMLCSMLSVSCPYVVHMLSICCPYVGHMLSVLLRVRC